VFKRFPNLLAGIAASVAMLVTISVTTVAVASTASADTTAAESKARNYFTNLEVVDQNGQRLNFYDDVLKGKVVAINFIFTNCQGACPLMTKNLTFVRDMMGGEVGKSVHFVSISIDPTRDTPAAMKEFAQTHDADHAGWTWVTGDPDNLAAIVKKLGSYTDDPEAHTTQMLAANVRTAHWTKIAPNVPPKGIVERLNMLIEEDAGN
jgi:cytochrome oxidase Cu insertion factor (SCO1/SenC/PrrC family)